MTTYGKLTKGNLQLMANLPKENDNLWQTYQSKMTTYGKLTKGK